MNYWSNELTETFMLVSGILLLPGIPIYMAWRHQLVYELAACIPAPVRPELRYWTARYFAAPLFELAGFVFGLQLIVIESASLSLGTSFLLPPNSDPWILAKISASAGFITGYGYSYLTTAYYTDHLLRTAELKREATLVESLPMIALGFGGALTAPWLAAHCNRLKPKSDDPYV